jgi:hypothetical protein
MGTIFNLNARRQGKKRPAEGGRFVNCAQCGERHPVVRFADGSVRCVTAFGDHERWFCRNRGCRAAWLARHTTKT